MYDHHNPPERNGAQSWPGLSTTDILFRIDDRLAEQTSRLGGLETGQRMMIEMQGASFDRHNWTDGQVARLNEQMRAFASATPLPPRGQSHTGKPGLLVATTALIKALAAALPELREVLLAAVVLAGVLGWSQSRPTGLSVSPNAPPAAVSPSAP